MKKEIKEEQAWDSGLFILHPHKRRSMPPSKRKGIFLRWAKKKKTKADAGH